LFAIILAEKVQGIALGRKIIVELKQIEPTSIFVLLNSLLYKALSARLIRIRLEKI